MTPSRSCARGARSSLTRCATRHRNDRQCPPWIMPSCLPLSSGEVHPRRPVRVGIINTFTSHKEKTMAALTQEQLKKLKVEKDFQSLVSAITTLIKEGTS